jgi:hypothetical protein
LVYQAHLLISEDWLIVWCGLKGFGLFVPTRGWANTLVVTWDQKWRK